MSIPTFPEINPEMTREHVLNMILASIAMEELALSHIINAEGEKLQYVLGTLGTKSGKEAHHIDELLCVNESVSNLLEMVSQNQMLLKNKMDKVLQAFPCERSCPAGPMGPPGPAGPMGPPGSSACNCCSCKCSAVFKGAYKCEIWNPGCSIPWNNGNVQGQCTHRDSCSYEKIVICSNKRYMVSLLVNVRAKLRCPCDIAVSLQMCNSRHCSDLFVFKDNICDHTTVTISMSGIIADTSSHTGISYLQINLLSPDTLTIEDAMLSIVEL